MIMMTTTENDDDLIYQKNGSDGERSEQVKNKQKISQDSTNPFGEVLKDVLSVKTRTHTTHNSIKVVIITYFVSRTLF